MKEGSFGERDQVFEATLRPSHLEEFIGHENIKTRLHVYLSAAKERNEPLGHILFHGPPGLGKTTLAAIMASEMGSHLVTTSGPTIEKAGDLAGILTNLEEGDVLFIDEIHRLHRNIEEYLYPALENFSLDLMLDSGPSARSVQVKLKRFTLVGATTKIASISSPLRSRFHFSCRLDYYDNTSLAKIVLRASRILGVDMSPAAALEIAIRSRGTPRCANNLMRWVRDFAQIQRSTLIEPLTVREALNMIEIDELGLEEMDKKILRVIIEHHAGGPVGVATIAAAIGEDSATVSEVYEPYLMMKGLLKRTPRGREATHFAYEHLGLPYKIVEDHA